MTSCLPPIELPKNPSQADIFSFVDSILDTYELNERVRVRVRSVSLIAVTNYSDMSFDDIYCIVGRCVDDFTRTSFGPSLQQSVSVHKEGISLEDVLIGKDSRDILPSFSSELKDEEDEPQGENIHNVLLDIKPQLTSTTYSLLSDLAAQSNLIIRDNLNVNEVRERAERLVKRYEINGKCILPPRPIESISNGRDIRIIFDNSELDDPKKYLAQHYFSVYWGLNRSELKKYDPALFAAIDEANLIDEVFPRAKARTLKKDGSPIDILKVFTSHPEYYTRSQDELKRECPSIYKGLRFMGLLERMYPQWIQEYGVEHPCVAQRNRSGICFDLPPRGVVGGMQLQGISVYGGP